jgi:hypothetical protein
LLHQLGKTPRLIVKYTMLTDFFHLAFGQAAGFTGTLMLLVAG